MGYAIIGGIVVVIIAIASAFFLGSSSGSNKEQNKTLKEIDKVQDAQAKIAVEHRTPADVASRLRDGTF